MGNRSGIAITLTTAALLGVGTFVNALHPGVLGGASNWLPWVLALIGVFVVDRWWAVLSVLAYPAAWIYIDNFTGYVNPWQSESVSLPGGVEGVVIALILIGLCLGVFAIPLFLRAFWRWLRSERARQRSLSA